METNPFDGAVISLWAHMLLILSVTIGVFFHLGIFWRLRALLSAVVILLSGVSFGLLLVSDTLPVFILILMAIQAYRIFGLLRIFKNRQHGEALRIRSIRSELVLGGLLLGVSIVAQLDIANHIPLDVALFWMACLQVIASLIFWQHSKYIADTTLRNSNAASLPDSKLPSLTVAIPARNETSELTDCIYSVLASNYPKLEVLVLDDCSQDQTSDLIKGFAHRGVRFISGRQPASSWLAKNSAYDQLLDEAGGTYVLFCGTDVRFQTNTLRRMVEQLVHNQNKMMSMLPKRRAKLDMNYLLQPMRYWREIAMPRVFDKTPPVLSTCWVAERKFLLKSGGFAAYKKSIRPELMFARLAASENKYQFLRSNSDMQLESVKGMRSQWGTAVRTRYPELKQRPENILFASAMYLLVFLGSSALIIAGFVYGDTLVLLLAITSTILLLATHLRINSMIFGGRAIFKTVLFPLHVTLEIIAMNYSMWAYEYGEVRWKGRNICLPVLQITKRLPDS